MDRRIRYLRLIVFLVFALIILRFWYLQIYNGDKYLLYSRKNIVRVRIIPPMRGDIVDRNGRILAGTRPAYDLYLDMKMVKNPRKFLERLQARLHLPFVKNFEKNRVGGIDFVKIAEDIPRDLLAWVEVHRVFYPALVVQVWYRRTYYEPYVPHVIGYIGEINRKELERFRKEGLDYRYGDWVGKAGIEKLFEKELRGKSGYVKILVDAQGRVLRVLKREPPRPGRRIRLTIDADLQKKAMELMRGKVGALVAADPRSGEILAWVSSPWFDPEEFARGISRKRWEELAFNPLHPMEDRVRRGVYPPGSTFKPFVALAALQEKLITPLYKVFCTGEYRLGTDTFGCWKKYGHGWTDLHKALVQSCDVYFYTVGDMLGIEKIAEYAKLFGFGKKTGIELPGERVGLVPTPEWKKKTLKEPWYEGETIPVAIGQGYLLVTPLQQVRAYSAIAMRGRLPYLHILKDTPQRFVFLPIDRKYFDIVVNDLVGVVSERHGTGGWARVRGVDVAGKTGTAQVVKQQDERNKKYIKYWHRDHGWFVAVAPAEHPQIAVAVVIEHGGHGGSAAAPIVGKLLRYFFSREHYAKN